MPQNEPLLLLFDGNALVHRAFHALPPLATKKGEATGAVYGFATIMLKVLAELKPTHCAVAFDYPAPTFRHHKYVAYKEHRPPTPDELKSQFQRVRQLVAALNMPQYELEGYEADDILGALSRQASNLGINTIIVSGDIDTLQLVAPGVQVLLPRPGKPFSDTVLYDEGKVKERYGISPSQLPDLKGLAGDVSDNIPGVRGIGEKTAVKLITAFASIEGMYEHIQEVTPPKARETLRQNEEIARLSKSLATINADVTVILDLDACAISHFDRPRLVELFQELEFHTLLGRLDGLGIFEGGKGVAAPQALERNYTVVDNSEALDKLVRELSAASSFAIDVEAAGADPMYAKLVTISLSSSPGRAYCIPVGHRTGAQLPWPEVREKLKPLLESAQIAKIAHNGKHGMMVLTHHGVVLQNLTFDTMIAAYLLGEKALDLKTLAFSKLGIEVAATSDLTGKGAKQIPLDYIGIPSLASHSCDNASVLGELARLLESELKTKELWRLFADVEMPLVPVLLRMELNGVALDTEALWRMSQELGQRMTDVEIEIYNSVGHQFNINSTRQLSAVLFEELRLPAGKKKQGAYSTEAAVLEGLRGVHPVIEFLLEYRQLSKLKSTYIDSLPALINPSTGRIHTNFNQTGTTTGRLSSSDPNLQNIPIRGELGRQIRRAFIAAGDWQLLSADYSQIDLRVLAHLSQDPQLVAAFNRDEDIHRVTAAEVFRVLPSEVTPEMRRVAKTVNFGVIYGMSGYGLEQATEFSREEASRFIDAYFERYPLVKQYLETTKKQAHQLGYVKTLLGRRRYIPEINATNPQVRAAAERMAINMPVQGTSADIIKIAMINLHREMERRTLASKMLLQVHDELLFEVPPQELEVMTGLVQDIMPKALELSVPLKVEVKVGKSWGEME